MGKPAELGPTGHSLGSGVEVPEERGEGGSSLRPVMEAGDTGHSRLSPQSRSKSVADSDFVSPNLRVCEVFPFAVHETNLLFIQFSVLIARAINGNSRI